MFKSIYYVLALVFTVSLASAQKKAVYTNGELKGITTRLEGQHGGNSVTINSRNENGNLSVGFSGKESWSIVFFDFENDSLNPQEYKYLSFKIKADSTFLMEEIGCGARIENSERVKKFTVTEDWQELVVEMPYRMDVLKTPFLLISKAKGKVEIEKVEYLKELPEKKEGVQFLVPVMEERIPDAKYVYSNSIEFGAPSGYAGENNGSSMLIDDHCMESPYRGKYCIKFTIDDSEAWRSLFFQATGRWTGELNDDTKLESLEEYKKLVFYAKSKEKRFMIPKVGFGLSTNKFNQEPRDMIYLKLTNEWKRYELDLRGLDRDSVNDVLFLQLGVGTFYMDEIRFEK